MTKAAKLTRLALVLAVAPCALLLAGCGESESEKFEKAKAEVCTSRKAIETQVETLRALPASVGSVTAAEKGFEVIKDELKKIKEVAPKLKPETRTQVEKATSEFTDEVTKVAESVGATATPSNLLKEIEAATTKVLTSYQSTLKKVSCGGRIASAGRVRVAWPPCSRRRPCSRAACRGRPPRRSRQARSRPARHPGCREAHLRVLRCRGHRRSRSTCSPSGSRSSIR